MVSFTGYIGSFSSASRPWTFMGPTQTVTVAAGQKLVGSAVAVLATMSATPVTNVGIGLCSQLGTTGALAVFAGGAYTATSITSTRATYAASAVRTGLAAGTYTVGFCFQTPTANGPIDNNEWVNGWVMVVN